MSFDFTTGRSVRHEYPAPEIEAGLGPVVSYWDRFIPEPLLADAESHRRARLIVRFGILGAIFGMVYASFYAVIGHSVGAWVILACSLCIGAVPFVLNRSGNLNASGHCHAAVLLSGFTLLSLVEGGMKGHAIAWLASIPLCVLLLVEMRAAITWTVLCTLVVAGLGISHVMGLDLPKTYPMEWEATIDLAGYVGLIPFMALLGVIFEVTRQRAFDQLKEALENLSKANSHLVRLNEDKNEFMNIAAHDLKNPLGVISGYAGLLQMFDDHDSASVKEHAGEILCSANRMIEIIRKLLDTRAIEDGHLNLRLEHCLLSPLLSKLLRDYGNASQAKAITLSVDNPIGDAAVVADQGALFQILDNFLSNAIKYSPQGRSVRIVLARDRGGNLLISVIDQGPGLSTEDQAKLFGKFTRLTPQPTGGESSNGLGLWIVKRMAQMMEGEVTCQSALGAGSTFTLALPDAGTLEDAPKQDDFIGLIS